MRKLLNVLAVLSILTLLSLPVFITEQLTAPRPVSASVTETFYVTDRAYWAASNAVYATAHDAATGTLTSSGMSWLYAGQNTAGGVYTVYRTALRFNTSGLPDDAVISAASLSFVPYFVDDGDDFNVSTCNGSALAFPFVAAGYNTLFNENTSLGSISEVYSYTRAYIDLNATGIAEINVAGYSTFGIRTNDDIGDVAPIDGSYFNMWAHTSSTYGIFLTVTYTSAPSIDTTAATSVTISTARLNSLVTNDGGLDCFVRFQYGLTAAYGIDTAWASPYTTGMTPYATVIGLSENTVYHFRAQIYNSLVGSGSPSNGVDLTFTTGSAGGGGGVGGVAFGRPLNLTAIPLSETDVLLNWEKGSLAYMTKIQYSTSDFPDTYNSGTNCYFDEYSTVLIEDLEPGTTYYFSAWSYTPADNTTGVAYWSDYEPALLNYTLQAGTTTTLCVDNEMLFTDEQYYRGCYAHNITSGDEERLIIDYDGATYSSTLISAIAGQAATDNWYVILRCDAMTTTLGGVDDWTMPDDSGSFNEPDTSKLANFPMNEVVQMWADVSGMSYANSWAFWGMIIVAIIGIAVALVSESALMTIVTVIVIMAGGYFIGVFALWMLIMYIILGVPLGWALAKW